MQLFRVHPELRTPLWLRLAGAALLLSSRALFAQVSGTVSDPTGRPIAGATVELAGANGQVSEHTATDGHGRYKLGKARAGIYQLRVRDAGFQAASRSLAIGERDEPYQDDFQLAPGDIQSVTVTADTNGVSLLSPDPGEKVFVKEALLDANPGRPGAPVSLPGYPIETASSGIKAPQYFAPGVAGDHGEPIAQFIAVGGYLLPNNLSANAHGNGYADPNIMIPETLSDVRVDGGAFNVLEGSHSVNLAATYGIRQQLDPFLTLTGDWRDIDLVAGLRPGNLSWVALEAAYGNGFLERLEHRQQYKLNGERIVEAGAHRITIFGIGYYGTSYIPGLVPINPTDSADAVLPNVGDTIDPRQKEQTHTALLAGNDVWTLSGSQQVQFSGFFRTYNLSLFSDFGQGLIRQSEFRTVAGGSTNYTNHFSDAFSLLGGLDVEREAPRRDDLDHYDFYVPGNLNDGPFTKVDASNVTITPVTPYAAAQGAWGNHLRYYAGWRRDEIDFNNQDLLQPTNSFQQWTGVNSPKATVSVLPGPAAWAPLLSGSFGESFFTEDPRIGTGTTRGTTVSGAHSYQLVVSRSIAHTDLRLTLGHVTTSEELAKIDPDTGLQEDQGPGRMRFLTATVRQSFTGGSLLLTFSKADARDIDSGQPTAEAPRTIIDALGTVQKLPFRLQAKAELEYVGAKPLGTGCLPNLNAQCVGVPVTEFRGAAVRPFAGGRYEVGINFLAASGFTGQTLESFGLSTVQEITGVRIPSYASVSFSFHPGEHGRP